MKKLFLSLILFISSTAYGAMHTVFDINSGTSYTITSYGNTTNIWGTNGYNASINTMGNYSTIYHY